MPAFTTPAPATVTTLTVVPDPAPVPLLTPVESPELDEECLPSLWRREALHRRALGVADVLAATLALFVVLNLLGDDQTALAAVVSTPLVKGDGALTVQVFSPVTASKPTSWP